MITATANSRFATVNGLRLHYLDWGDSGKPVLICLHGNTGQAGTWNFLAQVAAGKYHVVGLDQRGHGESQWAPDGYDRDSYVSDLAAFVDHLGAEKVTLVGLSLGGGVSMGYASAYPNRVEKLVLVDIAPEASAAARNRMGNATGYPLEFDSLEEAVDWARNDYLWPKDPGLRDDLAGRLRRRDDGKWTWKADPGVFNPSRPRRWVQDPEVIWQRFGQIECPVLEVRGTESDLITDETLERMREVNPQCQTVDIAGAGHNVIVDKPNDFLEAVETFLELL